MLPLFHSIPLAILTIARFKCYVIHHRARHGFPEHLDKCEWDAGHGGIPLVVEQWAAGSCRLGLQLQYKYVVRNSDGSVARWMAGDNFELLTSENQSEQPGALRVSDAWDTSMHAIQVPPYCVALGGNHVAILWLAYSPSQSMGLI